MSTEQKSVRVTINRELAQQLVVILDLAAPNLPGQWRRDTTPFYKKIFELIRDTDDTTTDIQEALK